MYRIVFLVIPFAGLVYLLEGFEPALGYWLPIGVSSNPELFYGYVNKEGIPIGQEIETKIGCLENLQI